MHGSERAFRRREDPGTSRAASAAAPRTTTKPPANTDAAVRSASGSAKTAYPITGRSSRAAQAADPPATIHSADMTERRDASAMTVRGTPRRSSETWTAARSSVAAAWLMPTEQATMRNDRATVTRTPVETSCMSQRSSGGIDSVWAAPAIVRPAAPKTPTKLVMATPLTWRHAAFGSSSTMRVASSRGTVRARRCRRRDQKRTNHGPSASSARSMPPNAAANATMIAAMPPNAPSRFSEDMSSTPTTSTTTAIRTRTRCAVPARWRVRTPSGVTTTARRPTTALSAASSVTAKTRSGSDHQGSHTSEPRASPRKCSRPTSGAERAYRPVPRTAPARAVAAASRTVSHVTVPVVAPSRRSDASRSSRRRAASRAAEAPTVPSGTSSSTRPMTARVW